MVDHPVPKTQIETLREIIEGYYEAGEVDELVEQEDVVPETDLGEDVIRRQKKFLADIGILEKDGYDYTLLEPGNQIGRALAFDRESNAKENFKQLFVDWDVTSELERDLVDGEHDRGDVIDSLAYITETDLSNNRNRTGLSALIDLYQWTGILSENSDGKYHAPNSGSREDETESEPETNSDESQDNDELDTEQTVQLSKNSDPSDTNVIPSTQEVADSDGRISVDITLLGEENPQNVENLILSVRRGLEKELEPEQKSDQRESGTHQPLDSFETDE